eukprot:NODE_788_length_1177_cov_48.916667_g560_i0.p1 GENE.NODE_788_length_1177_cov_48.916667_g560_i0~~NODE_788_length_1177_cov_48.916667_g560_i0.p1  ORF type:complete len:275 (-),score=79.24 NODE_788_length_1177_cov_48.916667_g560_i0:326-1150(-)
MGNPHGTSVDPTLPGPGAYYIRSACFDNGELSTRPSGPGFTLGAKDPLLAATADVPGPGAYDSTFPDAVGQRAKGFSFTSRPKEMPAPDDVPGPGAYEFFESVRPKPTATMKFRQSPRAKDDVPGPGAYEIASCFGRNGKGATMHAKLKHSSLPEELPHSRRKQQEMKAKADPGPGAYDPRNELADEVNKSMGITIRGRLPEAAADVGIGPGTYDTSIKWDRNAKITIKHPLDNGCFASATNPNGSPGPGAYDVSPSWVAPSTRISNPAGNNYY